MDEITAETLIKYLEQHALRGKDHDPSKDVHYQAKRQAKES